MSDEHDIPVKVIDRRWWATNPEGTADREASSASLKPTYVEELERQVAEKDKQVQEYIGKYRQASSEFEEARLRLRREISKDVERARREVLAEILEVVDNFDRAVDSARQAQSVEAVVQGIDIVRRHFLSKLEGLGVTPDRSVRPIVRSAAARSGHDGPDLFTRAGRGRCRDRPSRIPRRRGRASACDGCRREGGILT